MPGPEKIISEDLASSLPADAAWDEALVRVESYLHAHHLEDRPRVSRLAALILADARAGILRQPAGKPVAFAMQVTHACIDTWLERAGKGNEWANEQDRPHEQLALVLAHLPGRWSDDFLSAEAVPPELTAALAGWHFQSGPGLRFSHMPPAPLEFDSDEIDARPDGKAALWPLVRTLSSWLLVAGLISVAWAASH